MSIFNHLGRNRQISLTAFTLLMGLAACSDAPTEYDSPPVTDVSEGAALEAPMVLAEPSVIAEPSPAPAPPGRYQTPRRGVVTAGDIDDTLNLAAFTRYQSKAARELGLPKLALSRPVQVQLTAPDGRPAPGVPVTLRRPGAASPFYQGYSGVDGRITVFPALHGSGSAKRVEIRSFAGDQQMQSQIVTTGTPAKMVVQNGDGWQPDFLDLVFVFDTTGSMGDELDWLTKEFGGIVQAARRAAPGANIRFGLVAYRDKGDLYVVRNFGFTRNQSQMQGWLRSLDASGGGDYPEAAAEALQAAAGMTWRRGKGERLLFHIADAPAHKSRSRSYLKAAETLARKQVQIFGLGASGVAEESEFLMRQAALASSGRYLFLTDDSGVGYAHAEPTVACYRVTRLKSLLVRVLRSELTGIRQEARDGEVIRSVGTYRNGVCAQ